MKRDISANVLKQEDLQLIQIIEIFDLMVMIMFFDTKFISIVVE